MKLAHALLALAGFASAACTPDATSSAWPAAEEIAGQYGQGAGIAALDLAADGRYESLILNGITIDGCGTFEGAGVSKGTWAVVDEEIRFSPESEPADLVVKFAEVRARPVEDGLHVVVGEREGTLSRLQPYD